MRQCLRDHRFAFDYILVRRCFYTGPDGVRKEYKCPQPKRIKIAPDEQGRKAWRELHLAALRNEITPAWLVEWRKTIPRYGCQCLQEWDRLLVEIPFDTENQFDWSVKIHNAVNVKPTLAKRIVTLEEAKAFWQTELTKNPMSG